MGGVSIDLNAPDGKLRPAVGVENRQVFRANRTHPELADGFGWTYNHAPMLAYWNGKFYLEYLSNPIGEHVPPGQTFVITSADGRDLEQAHGRVSRIQTAERQSGDDASAHGFLRRSRRPTAR